MTKPDAVKAVNKLMRKAEEKDLSNISAYPAHEFTYSDWLIDIEIGAIPINTQTFDDYEQVTRFLEGK